MKKVLIINGPNINLLGTREKDIYGSFNYDELNEKLKAEAKNRSIELDSFQSNHEGEIVDRIQSARTGCDIMIVNAGAFTHTSVAIRDALLAVSVPFIEVHISNVYKREEFRHKSYLSDIAAGVIAGFGPSVYFIALHAVESIFSKEYGG